MHITADEFPADFDGRLRESICLLALCGWQPREDVPSEVESDVPLQLVCGTCFQQGLLFAHSTLQWPRQEAVQETQTTFSTPATPETRTTSAMHPYLRRQLTPEQAAASALQASGRRFGAVAESPCTKGLFALGLGSPSSNMDEAAGSPAAKRQRLQPHVFCPDNHRPFCPFDGENSFGMSTALAVRATTGAQPVLSGGDATDLAGRGSMDPKAALALLRTL